MYQLQQQHNVHKQGEEEHERDNGTSIVDIVEG